MDWFSLWLNIFSVTAQGVLQLSFSGHFTGKKAAAPLFAFYLFLLYSVFAFNSDIFAVMTMLMALYGMNRLFLHNSPAASCVTTVISVYVAQLSFGIMSPIEVLLLPELAGRVLTMRLLVWLATLLSVALCLFCYWIIAKYFSLGDNLEPYVWMLLPPILFFLAVEFYILYILYGNVTTIPSDRDMGRQLMLLALQALGLGALFCALFAYKRTCDGFRAQAALSSLAQETHAQRTYVAQAQMRYEQTRSFRHDIKNHLSVLDGLLKSGLVAQAQSYLQKLDTVAGKLSFPVCTGNPVVDILLGDKLDLAKSMGARVELALELPNPCGVEDWDLCVIFANALDNAIQACTQSNDPKWIHITGERQGDFYMLEFENPCSFVSDPVMGTGLSNVKAVAEKYGGAMTIDTAHSIFKLNVLLNLSFPLSARPGTL